MLRREVFPAPDAPRIAVICPFEKIPEILSSIDFIFLCPNSSLDCTPYVKLEKTISTLCLFVLDYDELLSILISYSSVYYNYRLSSLKTLLEDLG